jgi:hypothetical protein
VDDAHAASWSHPTSLSDPPPVAFDIGVAHVARVYNYWLGGKDHFAADREAAELFRQSYPDIHVAVRAQRAFLARAVRHLAAEQGIRQFLDIGTGLPSASNTHEVAQEAAPESRIVYVDNDPVVLAHARALLVGDPRGSTAYIDADLRDTGEILQTAAETLDFRQPIAVMLFGILQCIPDTDDPASIVRRLVDAVPSGSCVVISHPASDILAEQMGPAARRMNALMATPITLRSRAQAARFFDGLELLPPGLIQAHRWRAEVPDPDRDIPNYGAIARKP